MAFLAGGDELGVPEQIEMIRDARSGHGKSGADLAGGEVALLEHFEDAAAGRIAESFEEEVQQVLN